MVGEASCFRRGGFHALCCRNSSIYLLSLTVRDRGQPSQERHRSHSTARRQPLFPRGLYSLYSFALLSPGPSANILMCWIASSLRRGKILACCAALADEALPCATRAAIPCVMTASCSVCVCGLRSSAPLGTQTEWERERPGERRTRKNANDTHPSQALRPLAMSPCCSSGTLPIAPAATVPASPPTVVRKSSERCVHQAARSVDGGGIGSDEGGMSLCVARERGRGQSCGRVLRRAPDGRNRMARLPTRQALMRESS